MKLQRDLNPDYLRCSTDWAIKPCWKQVKCEFNLYPSYELRE